MDVVVVLDRLAGAAAEVAELDIDALDDAALKRLSVGVQEHVDRMRVLQARTLRVVDQRLVRVGSGARDAAGWFAEATGGAYRDAARQAELGKTLEASPELAAAVDDGSLPLGVAEAIASTACDPELAPVVDELLSGVAGAGAREAKRIADQWAAGKRRRGDGEAQRVRAQDRRFLRFGPAHDGSVTGSFNLPMVDARSIRQALEHLAGVPAEDDRRRGEQRLADALVGICDAYSKGTISGGRERPTLLVTVPADVAGGHGGRQRGDQLR